MGKKWKASGVSWLAAVDMGRFITREMHMCLGKGTHLAFAGWYEIGRRRLLRKLSIINQVLAIWGQMQQGLLFGFVEYYLKIVIWLSTSLLINNRIVSFTGYYNNESVSWAGYLQIVGQRSILNIWSCHCLCIQSLTVSLSSN